MKQVTFGLNGLNGHTPKAVKAVYRMVGLLSTLWVVTLQPNLHLDEHIMFMINNGIIIGNTAIYTICQFFGWSDAPTAAPEKAEQA